MSLRVELAAGACEADVLKSSYKEDAMRAVLLVSLLAVLLVTTLATVPAQARVNAAEIAQKTPFSAEANYMSLPGYLRWQTFVEEGRWISRLEAVREIKAAGGDPTITYEDTIVLRHQAGEVSQ
jgi:hypothetical protein